MTLPPAAAHRQLKHRRQIDIQVYACGGGRWEVDATLFDLKTRDTLRGGVFGWTHITELAQVLPTAVVQAVADDVIDTRGDDGAPPFQVDRCHALRRDGDVVRQHHPRWYRAASPAAPDPHDPPRSPE